MTFRAYQAPKINQTPVNQRGDRWASVKDLKAPFGDEASKESNTFGYWFNYLWEEARHIDTPTAGDRGRLCDAFFAVLTLDTAVQPPVSAAAPALATMSDDQKRTVLTTLLTIGFKRVALGGAVPAAGGRVNVARAVDAKEVFLDNMRYADGSKQKAIHLGFRSDGRSYEDLVKQKGFKARARSWGQDVYKWYAFDKPWHPFSLQVYADSLFLRKGVSKDNCLHTVVSVATSFADIVPYPLLSDASLFRWAQTPFESWTKLDEDAALAHKYKVRVKRREPNGPIDHLESEVKIFVLRMNDATAFSTMKWQGEVGGANPFPEAAVNELAPENILAEVEVTRRHYFEKEQGGNRGDLTLYDLEIKGFRLFPSEEMQKALYGETFVAGLKAKIGFLGRGARNHVDYSRARANYERLHSPVLAPAQSNRPTCKYCQKPMSAMVLKAHEPTCAKKT